MNHGTYDAGVIDGIHRERARIVAWLREVAGVWVAEAVERGDHLKPASAIALEPKE